MPLTEASIESKFFIPSSPSIKSSVAFMITTQQPPGPKNDALPQKEIQKMNSDEVSVRHDNRSFFEVLYIWIKDMRSCFQAISLFHTSTKSGRREMENVDRKDQCAHTEATNTEVRRKYSKYTPKAPQQHKIQSHDKSSCLLGTPSKPQHHQYKFTSWICITY